MSGSTACPTCHQPVITYDPEDESRWLDPSGFPHVHFKLSYKQGGLGTGTDEFLRASDIPPET